MPAGRGRPTAYAWGNVIDANKHNGINSGINQTVDVGQYDPNLWGFYDMHGNVQEWISDWKGPYTGQSEINPEGPVLSNQLWKRMRGGSFSSNLNSARSARRGGSPLGNRVNCSESTYKLVPLSARPMGILLCCSGP